MVDWLTNFWSAIWSFLTDKDNRGAVLALIAIGGVLVAFGKTIIGWIVALFSRKEKSDSDANKVHVTLSLDDYEARLRNREAEVRAELEGKHGDERARLQRQLDEVIPTAPRFDSRGFPRAA